MVVVEPLGIGRTDHVLVSVWMATSGIAGAVAGLIACWLPGNPGKWLWSGVAWLVPVCSIAAIAYMLSGYLTR